MLASMLEAVERALRQRAHAHAARRDPLRPRKPDRQRFVRAVDLTPEQQREIRLQARAEVAPPPAANPDPFGAPFPTTPIQPGADGARRT
jgi:hypothetical protein